MENEEANENVEVLSTVEDVYVDENIVLDTQDIPEMTYEEADAIKEQEVITDEEKAEGGK